MLRSLTGCPISGCTCYSYTKWFGTSGWIMIYIYNIHIYIYLEIYYNLHDFRISIFSFANFLCFPAVGVKELRGFRFLRFYQNLSYFVYFCRPILFISLKGTINFKSSWDTRNFSLQINMYRCLIYKTRSPPPPPQSMLVSQYHHHSA